METPNSLPIHIRVSAERHAALSQLAREERRPLATMISILVEEAMDARSFDGQAPSVVSAPLRPRPLSPVSVEVRVARPIVPPSERALDGSRVAYGANVSRSLDRQEVTPNPKRGKDKIRLP